MHKFGGKEGQIVKCSDIAVISETDIDTKSSLTQRTEIQVRIKRDANREATDGETEEEKLCRFLPSIKISPGGFTAKLSQQRQVGQGHQYKL